MTHFQLSQLICNFNLSSFVFFHFQVSVVAEEGQGAAEEAEEEAVLEVDEGDGEAAEVEVDRGGENPID